MLSCIGFPNGTGFFFSLLTWPSGAGSGARRRDAGDQHGAQVARSESGRPQDDHHRHVEAHASAAGHHGKSKKHP